MGVAVVTFDGDAHAASWVRQTAVSWPLLVDRDRRLYRAYGMGRGRPLDLYGPAAILGYVKLLLRGRRLRLPGGDVTQLGGDVLIDPDGIVRFHHVGKGPADRPPVGALLAAVAAAQDVTGMRS